MTLLERLDRLELELRRLDRELSDLRAALTAETSAAEPSPLRTPPPPPPQPPAAPAPPPSEPAPARQPSIWSREVVLPRLEAADLLGARGLALAGGVVTLLGVVFFFALAASNGWIGPVARVVLGGAASAAVFAAGVVAHARYGRTYAAVAAAGAGTAGAYATLLFAAARYELVPPLAALALAAGIAASAVALSLRWSSEIVAGLGLLGAMAVPAVALLDDDATATGTAFVALVFLGAAIVAVRQRWETLLAFSAAVSVPQLAVLVVQEGEPARARVLVVGAVFGLLYLGAGIAAQLRVEGHRLDSLAGGLAGGTVALTLFSSFLLLDGHARGLALAAAALVYAGVAIGLRRERELSSLGAAASSALVAVALTQFLDGPALVVAWAAETAALAWLGRRIADLRFQLLALAYLSLALAYTLVVEAPPDLLYTRGEDYLAGVPALLAVAAGALAYGLVAGSWKRAGSAGSAPGWLAELLADLHAHRRELRLGTLALAALLALDAASLAILDAAERLDLARTFEWGHVGVLGLWSAAGLAVLAVGLLRAQRILEGAGLALLAATLVSLEIHGMSELGAQRAWGALVVAVAFAAAGLLHGLLSRVVTAIPAVAVAFGAILSAFAATELFDGDAVGYALLVAAAAHAAIGGLVWRVRDLATPFWAAGVLLAAGAVPVLLEDTWLVLAVSVAAASLAWLGTLLREPRLWLASLGLAVAAALYALADLAPPAELLRANDAPGSGVPALLLVAAALGALGVAVRRLDGRGDQVDAWIDEGVETLRTATRWAAPLLVLYGASLAILELAQALGGAALEAEFQRGHTGVSALWGAVALAALVVGLRRDARPLRLAGIGLFAVALVKLFLYDLSTLSSVTRAASFLAVGAVLLLAGFLYQRLAAEERKMAS